MENIGSLESEEEGVSVLHLEDSYADAELVRRLLESEQLASDITLVSNKRSFAEALTQKKFDLILCDHGLPGYDGVDAWKEARQQQPGTPVIIVSGHMVDSQTFEGLKDGEIDFVVKQRLARLVPVIRQALQKARDLKKAPVQK